MLIVLEGLDGAGKSTQVAALKKYLEKRTGRLEYIHFPRYEAPVYGDLVSRFLRGEFGGNDIVHPQLVALLFALDRQDAAPAIRASLAAGKTVLLDRYVYSNIAYQCAKLPEGEAREKLRNWILETEFGPFNLPEPDLNLFLDVPISFVEERLAAARRGSDRDYLAGSSDIHEADINFQKEVCAIYRREASLNPRFLPVDCSGPDGRMLPPDVISSRVEAIVDYYLTRQGL